VQRCGPGHWANLARQIHGRCGKQCRERWQNHLSPNTVKNNEWTADDERRLFELHEELGNRWAAIARHMPGRNDNAVKNYYYKKMGKYLKRGPNIAPAIAKKRVAAWQVGSPKTARPGPKATKAVKNDGMETPPPSSSSSPREVPAVSPPSSPPLSPTRSCSDEAGFELVEGDMQAAKRDRRPSGAGSHVANDPAPAPRPEAWRAPMAGLARLLQPNFGRRARAEASSDEVLRMSFGLVPTASSSLDEDIPLSRGAATATLADEWLASLLPSPLSLPTPLPVLSPLTDRREVVDTFQSGESPEQRPDSWLAMHISPSTSRGLPGLPGMVELDAPSPAVFEPKVDSISRLRSLSPDSIRQMCAS
jgi:hypothetical protein